MSEQPEVSVRVVTPGYLRAMRIPLLQGRDISASDTATSAPVVVISQSMAKQFWPDSSPIGHHLKLSFYPDKDREIVGVVGDVKQLGLDSAAGIATLYWPLAQISGSPMEPWRARSLSLAVRTTTPPQTDRYMDLRRIEDELGYRPELGVDGGVARYLDWLREHEE